MNREGPGINPTHDLWVNNKEVWKNGEYLTEVITEYSIQAIREAKKLQSLFFYTSHTTHHTIQCMLLKNIWIGLQTYRGIGK